MTLDDIQMVATSCARIAKEAVIGENMDRYHSDEQYYVIARMSDQIFAQACANPEMWAILKRT